MIGPYMYMLWDFRTEANLNVNQQPRVLEVSVANLTRTQKGNDTTQ